jgi:hypothetical protein
MYIPKDSLWWDGNVPDIIYNGSDHVLLALTTFQELNVDDDFLSRLNGRIPHVTTFLMRILLGGRDS